jgi:hypothetical protein
MRSVGLVGLKQVELRNEGAYEVEHEGYCNKDIDDACREEPH